MGAIFELIVDEAHGFDSYGAIVALFVCLDPSEAPNLISLTVEVVELLDCPGCADGSGEDGSDCWC